jgi:hypothetical protein
MRASRWRILALGALAACVAACSSAPPTWTLAPGRTSTAVSQAPSTEPPTPGAGATVGPSTSPEVDACSEGVPDAKPVVATGMRDRGAILLAGTAGPEFNELDVPRIFLYACRWERDDSGVQETDGSGDNVEAAAPATISVDRELKTGIEPTEYVLAGRLAPAVSRVAVTLSDGSVQVAEMANGYWLAWWQSPHGPTTVTAFDASGAILSKIPASGSANEAAMASLIQSIPPKIGEWTLETIPAAIDPDGATAAVISAAGGDPSQTIAASVTASGPGGPETFTVLRNYGPSFAEYVDASAPQLAELGATERTELDVDNWIADQFATKRGAGGPPRTVVIASRSEDMNLYIMGDIPNGQLRTLLSALP